MAFIPVPDCVLVELRQSLFGQRVENTLYFRLTGGYGISEMTGLSNDLLLWWTTTLSPFLSDDLSLRELVVTDLSTATAPSLTISAPTPNPVGGSTSDSLPGSVAICVSIRTTNRGRSFRGRNYVAGLPENTVTGNELDFGTTDGIQAAYQGIPSAVVTDPWEWVVVSRFTAGAPRVTGISTLVNTAVIVDSFVDSQRRRLTGRGL